MGVKCHGHELGDALALEGLQQPHGPRRSVAEAEFHGFLAAGGAEGRPQGRGLEGAFAQQRRTAPDLGVALLRTGSPQLRDEPREGWLQPGRTRQADEFPVAEEGRQERFHLVQVHGTTEVQ